MPATLMIHVSSSFGGAELSLYELVRELDAPDKYVLALNPLSPLNSMIRHLGYKVYDLDIIYISKRNLIWKSLSYFVNICRYSFEIERICRRESISKIYCNTHRSLIYLLSIRVRNRIPIFCSCRDNINRTERWLIRSVCHKTLAVSEHIANQLNCPPHVEILYNSIRIDYTDPERYNLKKRYNLKADTVIIAHIANITPRKNQQDFINIAHEIIRKRKNVHFFIIGSIIDRSYYKSLTDSINKENTNQYITFTSFIPNIRSVIRDIDIMVHTSVNEPFGRTIIESMAEGKLVVAFESGSTGELIKNGKTGILIPMHDISAASEQIQRHIDDRERRLQISRNAKKYAQAGFDIKNYLIKYERATYPKD